MTNHHIHVYVYNTTVNITAKPDSRFAQVCLSTNPAKLETEICYINQKVIYAT